MAPSRLVDAPRVAASPCSLECRVVLDQELTDLDGRPVDQYLIVGQVVGVHLDEAFITPEGRVDTAAIEPIARCGYLGDYAVVTSLFEMLRPG
jgi:flavin reductase (DIM6/NTAB) family NADH-FMN oxidoreductase RutF